MPSSFRFFSISLLRAMAARSSADEAHPMSPTAANNEPRRDSTPPTHAPRGHRGPGFTRAGSRAGGAGSAASSSQGGAGPRRHTPSSCGGGPSAIAPRKAAARLRGGCWPPLDDTHTPQTRGKTRGGSVGMRAPKMATLRGLYAPPGPPRPRTSGAPRPRREIRLDEGTYRAAEGFWTWSSAGGSWLRFRLVGVWV